MNPRHLPWQGSALPTELFSLSKNNLLSFELSLKTCFKYLFVFFYVKLFNQKIIIIFNHESLIKSGMTRKIRKKGRKIFRPYISSKLVNNYTSLQILLFFYHLIIESNIIVRSCTRTHFNGCSRMLIELACDHVRDAVSPVNAFFYHR